MEWKKEATSLSFLTMLVEDITEVSIMHVVSFKLIVLNQDFDVTNVLKQGSLTILVLGPTTMYVFIVN